MKVLLVQPPTKHLILANNPAIIDEERGCNPPLGILYVAACLEKHSEHTVEVLDSLVEGLDHVGVEARIRQAAPDVVGITCLTFTLIDVLEVAARAKAACPGARVVVGGPHATIYSHETAALKNIDYVVTGEGEMTMVELVDALARGSDPGNVPGLVFLRNGECVDTGRREPIDDLDSIPFPARHRTPYRRYSSLLARGNAVTTMFTSRGCPFGCRYCDRPNMGRAFRARSPENVVQEFEHCVRMGIDEFLVYDDTFSVSRKRALAICEDLVRRGLRVFWDIRTRVDLVDEELLGALKRAGCIRIHYGVEAGNDRILKNLNRGVTIEQVRETFRLTKKLGIGTLGYFMIGNPGETRDDIEQTIRLAAELDPDFAHITLLTPFPGTRLYSDALAQGLYDRDHWLEFARNPSPGFRPRFWDENLTSAELQDLCAAAYRRFYGRPRFMLRRLSQIRSFRELGRNLRAGCRLFLKRRRKATDGSEHCDTGVQRGVGTA